VFSRLYIQMTRPLTNVTVFHAGNFEGNILDLLVVHATWGGSPVFHVMMQKMGDIAQCQFLWSSAGTLEIILVFSIVLLAKLTSWVELCFVSSAGVCLIAFFLSWCSVVYHSGMVEAETLSLIYKKMTNVIWRSELAAIRL